MELEFIKRLSFDFLRSRLAQNQPLQSSLRARRTGGSYVATRSRVAVRACPERSSAFDLSFLRQNQGRHELRQMSVRAGSTLPTRGAADRVNPELAKARCR